MLTPMAWAFTRICGNGVWRYLDKRRRSYWSALFYCLLSWCRTFICL